MVHWFGNAMLRDGRGGIALMSSLAGMQGSGYLASYAASKAFIRVLAESLWYEWREKGVDMMACVAGATTTPGYIGSRPEPAGWLAPRPQQPEMVAEECLKKIGRTPSFVSGRGNKLASFFMQHVLGNRRAVRVMGNTTRKIYRIRN
jgi:short-subunit dehydrogenase